LFIDFWAEKSISPEKMQPISWLVAEYLFSVCGEEMIPCATGFLGQLLTEELKQIIFVVRFL